MAIHSSILAWRIPRTEQPGGLPSVGVAESVTTEQLAPLLLMELRRPSRHFLFSPPFAFLFKCLGLLSFLFLCQGWRRE